jgi:hypothetical protein
MAYASKEDVAAVRSELKQAFPKWKFSVRKGSGSLSIEVNIMQGTAAFEGKTNHQVNPYWIDQQWANHEDRFVLSQINEIMHNAPGRANKDRVYFDHSDAMTDYFHTAFYTHLSIGQWDKPYQKV